MDFIPYASQSLSKEDVSFVLQSLTKPWITRGPLVQQFEEECANLCQAKYCVMFNSGTSALQAAYYAIDINPRDHLITSPNTFVGTVAGALQKTNLFSLLDIDLKTGSSSFENIEEQKSGRTVLCPVHYAGIAKEIKKPFENCVIIEDACEAFGASFESGFPVGSCRFSDLCVFSFHPAKTICTGEGGLVSTNSEKYYQKLLLYRNNGIVKKPDFKPWQYEVHDFTTNSNVTEFSAALGLSQLKRLSLFLKRRRTLVQRYRSNLEEIKSISFLDEKYDTISSHNLMPLKIDFESLKINREDFMNELKENKIGTQVHFIPLYLQPVIQKKFNFQIQNFPKMNTYYSQALSLPLYSHLKIEQVDYICGEIKKRLPTKAFFSSSKL